MNLIFADIESLQVKQWPYPVREPILGHPKTSFKIMMWRLHRWWSRRPDFDLSWLISTEMTPYRMHDRLGHRSYSCSLRQPADLDPLSQVSISKSGWTAINSWSKDDKGLLEAYQPTLQALTNRLQKWICSILQQFWWVSVYVVKAIFEESADTRDHQFLWYLSARTQGLSLAGDKR